jgi:hypothetical protein
VKKRPYVFVGSSSEGLEIAKAIQANLDFGFECHIWSQGLFGLSEGTLETLVNTLDRFDFAILCVTPDDITISRGTEQRSPRDNVLFELGLFMGGLGKDRVFLVTDRSAKAKLPSDLAGITPATYEPPSAGTMQSALGAACTSLESKMKRLGARRGSGVEAWWWTGCLSDGSVSPDFYLTVANRSSMDLPWLNVHVFPSNTFQLEPRTERTERLMQGQYTMYRFAMLNERGELSDRAKRFSEEKREEVSIRIFKNNSFEEPVLIDFELGAELFDRIQMFKKIIEASGPLESLVKLHVDLPLKS